MIQKEQKQKAAAQGEELKISQVCVSERTAKYIHLKAHFHAVWNGLYEAIEEDYGNADKVFDEKLYAKFNDLDAELDSYLLSSISEVMGERGIKNLI